MAEELRGGTAGEPAKPKRKKKGAARARSGDTFAAPATAPPSRRRLPIWVWIVATVVVATPVFLRVAALETFKLPSGSMMPTLQVGDHIVVHKLSRTPARGDVIVFELPENRAQSFASRVVGVGGDTVEYLSGRLLVGGKLLPRCSVGTVTGPRGTAELEVEVADGRPHLVLFDEPLGGTCTQRSDCVGAGGDASHDCRDGRCGVVQGPYLVKPGEVWVSGDNRHNTHDSRSWFAGVGGGVPLDHVTGEVVRTWLRGRDGDPTFADVTGRPVLGTSEASLRPALAACLTGLGV